VAVVPVDDAPRLVSAMPEDPACTVYEGKKAVFKLTAADNDTPELSCSWYVDGNLSRGATGNSFCIVPGYDAGGSVMTVRAESSDGKHSVNFEWTLTVLDTNRPPIGTITAPINMSKYIQGTAVILSAEGHDDDGDALTYIWRDQAGAELGRGATINATGLPRGTLTLRLEINDTRASAYRDVVIVVVAAPRSQAQKPLPGFETGLALLAAGLAMVMMVSRARREQGR
jgi:hypothetical protein